MEKRTTIFTDGWKAYQKITKLLTPVIAERIYSSRKTLSVWKGLPKAIGQLLEFKVDSFSSEGFVKLSDGLSWIPAVLNRDVVHLYLTGHINCFAIVYVLKTSGHFLEGGQFLELVSPKTSKIILSISLFLRWMSIEGLKYRWRYLLESDHHEGSKLLMTILMMNWLSQHLVRMFTELCAYSFQQLYFIKVLIQKHFSFFFWFFPIIFLNA